MREITESLVCNLGRRHFVLNVKNGEVGNEWMCKFVQGLCYQPFCRSLTSLCEDAMFPRKKRKRRGEKDRHMMVNGLRYIYKKSKREGRFG